MKQENVWIIYEQEKRRIERTGAQLLLMTFRVANKTEVFDLSTHDEAKYRVITTLYDQAGILLGTGVGEASSLEEKYMWRKAVCDEEWEAFPEDRRRTAYKSSREGFYTVKQVRTNPADVANTILKMSNKRSLVNSTCTCMGASEIFTQDAEDLPSEMIDEGNGDKPRSTKPVLNQKTEVVKPTEGFLIESIDSKSGVDKNKKPWTKYGITIAGKTYGTFDKKIYDFALQCKANNTPVVFQSAVNGTHINLTSLQAVTAPATVPETASAATQTVMGQENFLQLVKSLSEQAGTVETKWN